MFEACQLLKYFSNDVQTANTIYIALAKNRLCMNDTGFFCMGFPSPGDEDYYRILILMTALIQNRTICVGVPTIGLFCSNYFISLPFYSKCFISLL
jgi:hypothetical protein